MAMRRPRIKPVANILLNSKRKTKLTANDDKNNIVEENDFKSVEDTKNVINIVSMQEWKCADSFESAGKLVSESSVDTTAKTNNLNNNDAVEGNVQELESNAKIGIRTKKETDQNVSIEKVNDAMDTLNDSDAFKYPPKVEFQRTISHTSHGGIDDVFYSDIEENALQMDSGKSSSYNCPISPSKNLARQRIRPTPHFGQRRNSFVGSSPSPHTTINEDNNSNSNATNDLVQTTQTRRERHHSASCTSTASSHHHPHTSHKYSPASVTNGSMGRTRTESGCSVFSDTNTSTHKHRKVDNHKLRRDFEARFQNTTPEKNALIMSDLIHYNPATNPMEKKQIPSEKLKKPEISSIDAKPFAEKEQKDTESEAAPVPQLKLNAKGELILDDNSLVIETTAEQEARKALANSSLIYVDEYTGMNGFYRRRKKTRTWSSADTIKFYRCLQNVGTDFSLMVALFPNRTRRDIKLKFKKEERKNAHLINKAIVRPKLFDIESLKQELEEEENRLEKAALVKKKSKRKIKSNITSKASRVLKNTEGVYENESNVKPKAVSTTISNIDTSEPIVQNEKETTASHNNEIETAISKKDARDNKRKRKNKNKRYVYFYKKAIREKRFKEKNLEKPKLHISQDESVYQQLQKYNKPEKEEIIKKEIVKIENKQESHATDDLTEYQETKQLQTEIDELLGSDAIDIQYDNASYDTSAVNEFSDTTIDKEEEQINESHITHEEDLVECDMDIDKYEHTSFVNLNDGTVEVYSNIKDDIIFLTSPTMHSPSHYGQNQSSNLAIQPPICVTENENNLLNSTVPDLDINNDTCSSMISERELSESDIQSILTELAEGSLVLVSTLDPDDPDKVLNEIYMVDKNTGELCDEPLSIPDNIVQCILTVVS